MEKPVRFIRPLLWTLLAALSVYGASILVGDWRGVQAAAARLPPAGWAMILGLSLLNYLLRFGRWQAYLAWLGHRIPLGASLAYYLAGFALTTTPGKAGEAVRSLYLKPHGVPYADSLAAFFAERFVDVAAMVLLALAAAIAFPQAQWAVVVLIGAMLTLVPLVHSETVHQLFERSLSRLESVRLQRLGERALSLLRSAAALLRARPLYAGLAVGVIAWGMEGFAFHLILVALDVPVALPLSVGIYAISVLVGALSFLPGGLGSTEAAMALLVMAAGADAATAIAATLICRIATLWFAVVIGGVVLGGLAVRQRGGADHGRAVSLESRADGR